MIPTYLTGRYVRVPNLPLPLRRNEEAAARITSDARKLNSASTIDFIKTDASLLRNVDDVCRQIKAKEKHVNLLFMTQGYLTLSGRNGKNPFRSA